MRYPILNFLTTLIIGRANIDASKNVNPCNNSQWGTNVGQSMIQGYIQLYNLSNHYIQLHPSTNFVIDQINGENLVKAKL